MVFRLTRKNAANSSTVKIEGKSFSDIVPSVVRRLFGLSAREELLPALPAGEQLLFRNWPKAQFVTLATSEHRGPIFQLRTDEPAARATDFPENSLDFLPKNVLVGRYRVVRCPLCILSLAEQG